LKNPVFQGACTALVTPFSPGGVDYQRLRAQIEYQKENGISAILAAGTTGECPTLSEAEFENVTEACIRYAEGKMKVIAGIGGNDTKHCLARADFARRAGADAILMTTPYYNKGTQAGLLAHFFSVADRCDLPLILYNIPSRTGIGIAAETYSALAAHPNINGVKEASGDFSLIARIAAECSGDLNIWCGNDDQTLPMMVLGAKGVISVASNLVPDAVAKLCKFASEQQFDAAQSLFCRYEKLFRLLFIETNPIPVKAAMQCLGTDSGLLRLPLTGISDEHFAPLKRCLEELGLTDE